MQKNKTTLVKLTEEDIIYLASIGNAGNNGYGIKSIGYKAYVDGFNEGAKFYKDGIKNEYERLKVDNSKLLEDNGFLKIDLEHTKALLSSCETSLESRNNDIDKIRADNEVLLNALKIIAVCPTNVLDKSDAKGFIKIAKEAINKQRTNKPYYVKQFKI